MNKERENVACTVFAGKIVISGGHSDEYWVGYESVEAYNHHEDKWIFLPDMQFGRRGHSAVSMGNKMFVIGGNIELPWQRTPCEVLIKFHKHLIVLYR